MKEVNDHQQLLRYQEQQPDPILLKNILDKYLFEIIEKINQAFSTAGIDFEWKYYKDEKAWLGKATYKKKTIVWISVWQQFIKASFYFTEKTRPDVLDLNISETIKIAFSRMQSIGKLIPLTLEIKDEETLADFIMLLNYKKALSPTRKIKD